MRHAVGPRLGEGGLHDDVRVLAVLQGAEDLDDDRLGRLAVRVTIRQMIEVLDCSPDRTLADVDTRPVTCPVEEPVATALRADRGLRHRRRRRSPEDRVDELVDVDGVVRPVVDPARCRARCAPSCRAARARRPRAARRGR